MTDTRTKEELIAEIDAIVDRGFVPGAKAKDDDAKIGRTLENLLGIEENNLPLPNANEWELKGHRLGSGALVTLKHLSPSPKALRFVPLILLPLYGWPHKEAGKRHPLTEKSFRQTLTCGKYTDRGFTYVVNESERKIDVHFDATKVGGNQSAWLKTVEERVGLGPLSTTPYWGFDDLAAELRTKLKNAFYVEADKKSIDGLEHFWYRKVTVLSDFSFEKFIELAKLGEVKVDFDARTGHDHGTKFRVPSNILPNLYRASEVVIDR